ncbi:deoxycytidylate deaminase [Mycobacterium phage TroyPia]|nr:deoxycytidylate deaminase [Mycobacterium phage TroyPia]
MRPTWDEYFLGIARAAAERSDCERSKVGAVVVKDRRVRATGYNGAPARKPGCDTCPRRLAAAVPGVSDYDSGPTRCVAVHAEANALLYCDREDLAGATLYITREPCDGCLKLIEAAGVARVVTPDSDFQLTRWESNTYSLRMEPWMAGFIELRDEIKED